MSKDYLTLGSLFDGIGGWLLAAEENGIKPIWSSEIDEYPMAVSKYHFPDVEQMGDITKLDGATLPPVDIICAGSPCQDLSVAGKQEGLDGERSGLFRKAIEIVHEMREVTGGKYPSWFVWENVPGAFSSNKGADFRSVLEEITKESIPMPESAKWAKAGMVRGSQCDIAWRVLDAQYWGVPQRRKRIFLIADFREKRRAEILFGAESLSGDSEACKGARQGASADVEASAGTAISFEPGITARLGRPPSQDISTTLRAGMGDNQTAVVYGIGSYASNAMKSNNPHSGIYEADTSRTLDLNGGNPACNQGGMAVVLNDQGGQSMNVTEDKTATLRAEAHGNNPIVAIEGTGSRPSHHGDGYKESDIMYTLNSTEIHCVATFATKSYTEIETSDVSATLKAKGGTCGGGSESYVVQN